MRGSIRTIGVCIASLGMILPGSSPVTAQPSPAPTALGHETLTDLVAPSVVSVSVEWEGYVGAQGGDNWVSEEASVSCSGYIASSSGYIVTAGHCIDDNDIHSGGKYALTESFFDRVGGYSKEERQDYREDNIIVVEGKTSGSTPKRTVTVRLPDVAGAGNSPVKAEVVDIIPWSKGDVALLKIKPPKPLVALPLTTEAPSSGEEVMSAGFDGTVADLADKQKGTSFTWGRISGTKTVDSIDYIELSTDNSSGMSGGPNVLFSGDVLGTVSFGAGDTSFNYSTSTRTVETLLERNDIRPSGGKTEKLLRTAFLHYEGGQYEAASKAFNAVAKTVPANKTVKRYAKSATEKIPPKKDRSLSPATITILVLVGIVAVLVLALVYAIKVLRRPRRQQEPAYDIYDGPDHASHDQHWNTEAP